MDSALRERYQAVHKTLTDLSDHLALCGVDVAHLPEFMKTISSLFAQLERVKDYLDGKTVHRFFACIADENQAMQWLENIETFAVRLGKGDYPYRGRFIENGCTVIDHCIIRKGDLFHLFYIRGKAGYNWSESPTQEFGHAVSTDLKEWIPLPPVVHGEAGQFDSYQVWAPHIVEKDGRYYMFYAGVNEHAAQTVGIAVSDDLYIWEKYDKNPVLHTETWGYWGEDHWSDARDPMVIFNGQHYYMYYTRCHLLDDGTLGSCIGVSSSDNLLDWTDEGYIDVEDSPKLPPESPFMVMKDGKYYLFYTLYYVGTCCLVSDEPTKGFVKPDWTVIDRDLSASEVVEDNGHIYLTRITHEPNDVHLFDVREMVFSDGKFTCLPVSKKD